MFLKCKLYQNYSPVLYTCKIDIFTNLLAVIPFKFQWQTVSGCCVERLGHGFNSISPHFTSKYCIYGVNTKCFKEIEIVRKIVI